MRRFPRSTTCGWRASAWVVHCWRYRRRPSADAEYWQGRSHCWFGDLHHMVQFCWLQHCEGRVSGWNWKSSWHFPIWPFRYLLRPVELHVRAGAYPDFALRGRAELELPAKNYVIPVDEIGRYCLAFAPSSNNFSIIGNVQQQNFRVVFDNVEGRIGFEPDQCY